MRMKKKLKDVTLQELIDSETALGFCVGNGDCSNGWHCPFYSISYDACLFFELQQISKEDLESEREIESEGE